MALRFSQNSCERRSTNDPERAEMAEVGEEAMPRRLDVRFVFNLRHPFK
jgi:hypothetical protein